MNRICCCKYFTGMAEQWRRAKKLHLFAANAVWNIRNGRDIVPAVMRGML